MVTRLLERPVGMGVSFTWLSVKTSSLLVCPCYTQHSHIGCHQSSLHLWENCLIQCLMGGLLLHNNTLHFSLCLIKDCYLFVLILRSLLFPLPERLLIAISLFTSSIITLELMFCTFLILLSLNCHLYTGLFLLLTTIVSVFLRYSKCF